jgi:hypothetical protein
VAATIKSRIERHNDRIEAFFDSIGQKRKSSQRAHLVSCSSESGHNCDLTIQDPSPTAVWKASPWNCSLLVLGALVSDAIFIEKLRRFTLRLFPYHPVSR